MLARSFFFRFGSSVGMLTPMPKFNFLFIGMKLQPGTHTEPRNERATTRTPARATTKQQQHQDQTQHEQKQQQTNKQYKTETNKQKKQREPTKHQNKDSENNC